MTLARYKGTRPFLLAPGELQCSPGETVADDEDLGADHVVASGCLEQLLTREDFEEVDIHG